MTRLLAIALFVASAAVIAARPAAVTDTAAQCPPGAEKVGETRIGNTVRVDCRCSGGRVQVGDRCVTAEEAENLEVQQQFEDWLRKFQDNMRQDRATGPSPIVGLRTAMDTLVPVQRRLADLRPGDIVLTAPANPVGAIINLLTGRQNASHALTYIGSAASGMLFLDQTAFKPLDPSRGGGSHIIGQAEFFQQYGARAMQVARPLEPVDGRELLALALEYAQNDAREGGWKSFRPTSFSIVGTSEDSAACSVRAAMLVFRATGRTTADLDRRLKGLGLFELSPSSYFDRERLGKYFVTFPVTR